MMINKDSLSPNKHGDFTPQTVFGVQSSHFTRPSPQKQSSDVKPSRLTPGRDEDSIEPDEVFGSLRKQSKTFSSAQKRLRQQPSQSHSYLHSKRTTTEIGTNRVDLSADGLRDQFSF